MSWIFFLQNDNLELYCCDSSFDTMLMKGPIEGRKNGSKCPYVVIFEPVDLCLGDSKYVEPRQAIYEPIAYLFRITS